MNKLFLENKDQSSLNRFLAESPWDVDELTTKRMKVIDQNPKTRTKEEGVIILDDTVNPKTGKKMEGVGWHHYNNPSNDKKFTFGQKEDIDKLLKRAEEVDASEDFLYGEDNDGSGIPDEIKDRWHWLSCLYNI